MSALPAVSVVIPTHDRRDLLADALRGVLEQSGGVDLEVLVVDDGSSDGSAEMVRGLREPRIRLLHHEAAAGVSAARNRGIAEADGEWVALLDDDDLWAPDKLARQLKAAEERSRCWAYAGVVEIDADGRLLGGTPPPTPEDLVAGLAGRNLMPAGSSNVIVRHEALSQVGAFDEGLRHLADWDLWLRLAKVGIPACAPEPLVAYRIHHSQATLDTTGMVGEARVLEARHGANPASIYRWLGWSHLRLGQRGMAARAYVRAVGAGDPSSLLRAGGALLLPRPTRRDPVSSEERRWFEPAEAWLRESTGSRIDPSSGST